MRQAHASSNPYRPPRRQETGGPEPMDLCYVESERPRSSNNKRLQKCNRCQKLGHYAYECGFPRQVPNSTERNGRPFAKKGNGRGSSDVAKPQQRNGPSKKWTGSVGAELPTDPATSREFANLLTKVAPDTQSLCVSAPGDDVSLITLNL